MASANADFSILVQAVTRANLAGVLQAASPKKTVFAPTNAAFTALFSTLGVADVNALSVDQLTIILKYHVLETEIRAAAATTAAQGNQKVDSLGGKIQLALQGTTIRLDARASVVTADVLASNGVIHAIDQVLLPSALDVASTDTRFSSLATAVGTQADFVTTLDDNTATLTVFAPTNDAFTALVTSLRGADDGGTTGINSLSSFTAAQLRPVLGYHVMTSTVLAAQVPATGTVSTLGGRLAVARSGSSVTVDGVSVVIADLRVANGVIHAIGSVLLPSIADIATGSSGASTFGSLAAAVTLADSLPDGGTAAAGLAATLDSLQADGGSYTLFAPTVSAFNTTVAALRSTDDGGTTGINSLSSFTVPQITPILTYHVLPSRVLASQVPATATKVASLGGMVSVQRGASVTVDSATVTSANLFASNGVVHVIDGVILPSIADVVTTNPALSGLASLVTRMDQATVATALDGTTPYTLFAPDNDAVAAVSSPPTGTDLSNLLLLHAGTSTTAPAVVSSPIYAATVLGLPSPATLSTALTGRSLTVGPVSGTVRLAPIPQGGAAPTLGASSIVVTTPNLFTSNGVIHVIDGVLVP